MSGNLSKYSEEIENAVDSPVQNDFSPVPPGKYHLLVCDASVKTSSTGNEYVNVQFAIVGGKYNNRRIFEIFMLEGSEKSVAISFSSLSKLASFNGHKQLTDTSNIIGAHCVATVRVEEGTGGYQDKNRASRFEPFDGSAKPEAATSEEYKGASYF